MTVMSEMRELSSDMTPEPGVGHRPGLVTGGGVTQSGESSTQYTVIGDLIHRPEQNQLPEIMWREEDRQWVVQVPGDHQGRETHVLSEEDQEALEAQETLKELEALETLEDYGALDVSFPITSIRVDNSGDLSVGSLLRTGSHESQTQGVTQSPSPSDQDRDSTSSVTVTPPRYDDDPFIPDLSPGQSRSVQDWEDILREAAEDNAGQEEILAEILVPNADHERPGDESQGRQDNGDRFEEDSLGRKTIKGRRNKKKEEFEKKKREKEQKKQSYEQAVNAFKEHKYESYSACAKAYGVSDVTLRRMILRKKNFVGQGRPSNVLKEDEEEKLISHLKYCAKVGFGLSLYDVQLLIQELLSAVVR